MELTGLFIITKNDGIPQNKIPFLSAPVLVQLPDAQITFMTACYVVIHCMVCCTADCLKYIVKHLVEAR